MLLQELGISGYQRSQTHMLLFSPIAQGMISTALYLCSLPPLSPGIWQGGLSWQERSHPPKPFRHIPAQEEGGKRERSGDAGTLWLQGSPNREARLGSPVCLAWECRAREFWEVRCQASQLTALSQLGERRQGDPTGFLEER